MGSDNAGRLQINTARVSESYAYLHDNISALHDKAWGIPRDTIAYGRFEQLLVRHLNVNDGYSAQGHKLYTTLAGRSGPHATPLIGRPLHHEGVREIRPRAS
jgi:hypothetical protein